VSTHNCNKNTGIIRYVDNPNDYFRREESFNNYPGFDYPLTFCPIRPKHKPAMIKAVWKSHKELRGFIGWAKYARSWDVKMVSKFADDHINDRFPHQHFLFFIGDEMVGMGSLVSAYTPLDAQIALFVTSGYQGKGIGKQIVDTLEHVAFRVWGYSQLFYEVDAYNQNSKKLPQKCGFRYSHSFDRDKEAERESGYWFSWVKDRPEGLPDGIIQGRPIEDFTKP
jgi:RimJ/RimL family protein N-acetyltransferase